MEFRIRLIMAAIIIRKEQFFMPHGSRLANANILPHSQIEYNKKLGAVTEDYRALIMNNSYCGTRIADCSSSTGPHKY